MKFVILGIIVLVAVVGGGFYVANTKTLIPAAAIILKPTPRPSSEPTLFVFKSYVPPKIDKKPIYTIFMIGDSMTVALGPHGGTFYDYITELYDQDKVGILVDNYAKGSINILSVADELTRETIYWDSTFAPLLTRGYDIILVESFGYNPLSQFGVKGGIVKQNEALNKLMETLIVSHPKSAIVFVATIAPNKENYAKKVLFNVPVADRIAQAEERMAYIENHINYAKEHNIPIINIYEKSLNAERDGDLKYINPDDFIHPSFEGIDFIGHEIANFIYGSQILPK